MAAWFRVFWLFHSLEMNYDFGSFVYVEAMANSELAAQSPFCRDRGRALESTERTWRLPTLGLSQGPFLKDLGSVLAGARRRPSPGAPTCSGAWNSFQLFPLGTEKPEVMSNHLCVPGLSQNTQQRLCHQALLILSVLWHPPDTPAWISFNKNLLVCTARGRSVYRSNAVCPEARVRKTVYPAR